MSEKRFTIDDIYCFYDNGNPLHSGQVVDLLNELSTNCSQLQEENEQLKQEIKQYWKCRDKWKQEAKELKEENEQLRLELETHKHPLWSTREAERKLSEVTNNLADEVKKNGLLNEEINQLRIENMRLKKKCGDRV